MKMAYQRTGGSVLSWKGGYPPRSNIGQGRAADSLSLGEYTEETGGIIQQGKALPGALSGYERVPMPGAPEVIGDSIGPFPSAGNLLTLAAVGGVAYYFLVHKKKRKAKVGW